MSSLELQRAKAKNLILELKIISASDLSHTQIDDTNNMDVYAVVLINGDPTQKKLAAKTPIDYDGGPNPTWNHAVKFSVSEKPASEGLLTVKVKLLSFWLEGEYDLYLGEVNVSVQDLLASNPLPPFTNGNGNKMKSMTCPVKATGGCTKARLSLSYRFKPAAVPVDIDQSPSAPDYSLLFDQPVWPNPDPARSGQPDMHSPQTQTTTTTKLTLEILIKSAKDIKDVNTFSAMDVYASVLILVGKTVKHGINTPVAFSAYTNPTWNHQAMVFPIELLLAQEGRLNLLVKLISVRPSLGDKEIGRVKVPMQELLGLNPPSNVMKLVTHDVTGSYGNKGKLSFSYRFLGPQGTLLCPSTRPSTTFRPFAMDLPVVHQSNESYGMVHGTPDYYHVPPPPIAQTGASNGQQPISMPPPYQSHDYQQCSPSQPQQNMQSERPVVKPHEGRNMAALGLGAAFLGRAIGGVSLSSMLMSDEMNTYEVEGFGSTYSESII